MHASELTQVWKLIEPAVPDTIERIEDNIYEARWWKPVPTADVNLLCCAESIEILGEPYEPRHLPSGIAVRFALLS